MYWDGASPFQVEAMQQHGPRALSFHVASVECWWFISGCYIAPDDVATIENVTTAIIQRPPRDVLLVSRDFNMDPAKLEGSDRGEDIATAITTARMEDMSTHFLPRCKYWAQERRMWCMRCIGREVRS